MLALLISAHLIIKHPYKVVNFGTCLFESMIPVFLNWKDKDARFAEIGCGSGDRFGDGGGEEISPASQTTLLSEFSGTEDINSVDLNNFDGISSLNTTPSVRNLIYLNLLLLRPLTVLHIR